MLAWVSIPSAEERHTGQRGVIISELHIFMVICNIIFRNSPGSSTCWKELICQGTTKSTRLRDLQQTKSLAVAEWGKCLSLGSVLAESFCHITCFLVPEGRCLSRIKPSVLIFSSMVFSSYSDCWFKSQARLVSAVSEWQRLPNHSTNRY